MIRNLMALPCMLALVLACGQGRTDGQDTGATGGAGAESGALPADTSFTGSGIEDTTAAPSLDAADTVAPTGDTTNPAGETESDKVDSASLDQSGATNTEPADSEAVGATGDGAASDTTY